MSSAIKYSILYLLLFCAETVRAQEKNAFRFFGSFESNVQYLLDDEGLNFVAPEEDFRSNNYLKLDFDYGAFKAGFQYEAYLPKPLLGYDPQLEDHGFTNYYLVYDLNNISITAGYFYEQFGNGLILRAWEDRQLGINNALGGGRIKFNNELLELTGLYGVQRNRFETSESRILGFDAEVSWDQILKLEDKSLNLGISYVERDESLDKNIPDIRSLLSGRVDFVSKGFSTSFEGVYRSPDILTYNGTITNDSKLFDGSALFFNVGYVQKGLGVDLSLRRLENFSFYSERLEEGNQYNQLSINYVPALTKQHDYLLNNIYVYTAQNRLIFQTFTKQAGEIGYQTNLFYSAPKDSFLGGKFGTYVELNISRWAALQAQYDLANNSYSSDLLGFGKTYFNEYNLSLKKKWNKKWNGIYALSDLRIDKGVTDGSPVGIKNIEALILVADNSYDLEGDKSVKLELQHLWTQQDRKNWAAGVIEYNFNYNFGLYVADSWNYGGEDRIHYYNIGGSYSKANAVIGINYGRQRGGLICVGGVCRFVPENTGISVNLSYAF